MVIPFLRSAAIAIPLTLAPVAVQAAEGAPSPATDAVEQTQPRPTATPVHRVAPQYPAGAAENGSGGSVLAEYSVDPQGRVSDVRIVESEPPGLFDAAVLRSIQSWKFLPLDQEPPGVQRENIQVRLHFGVPGSSNPPPVIPFDCSKSMLRIAEFKGDCRLHESSDVYQGRFEQFRLELVVQYSEERQQKNWVGRTQQAARLNKIRLNPTPIISRGDLQAYPYAKEDGSSCAWFGHVRPDPHSPRRDAYMVGALCRSDAAILPADLERLMAAIGWADGQR